MNRGLRNNKGFTLIELAVAIAILALMASFAGAIFKVSIESHRVAGAHAEIMQKLRTITDQLNADFKGLRKDGEIAVAWVPVHDPNFARYARFDRIMFFADGDFQSYWPQASGPVRGNLG
jgi:prepilin-type N-terminal cleavage/methylation domain-containing protein